MTGTSRRRFLQIGIAGVGAGIAGAAAWMVGRQRAPEGEVLYDDGAWRRTDPALVRWHETGRIQAGMLKPRGIALAADGTLYLAGDRVVAVVSPEGRRLADIACPGEPRALAVAGGTVYAGLRDRIVPIRDGRAGEPWAPVAPEAVITGLAVHPEGDVYAADAGSRALWRLREGRACNRIGGEGDAEFVIPSPYMDVQVGPDGLVWVANTGRHRLEAYDRQDRRVRTWGVEGFAIEGFCGCCNPADFAILGDGTFITSEKGLPRVKRYAADGGFREVVAPVEAFAPATVGIDLAVAADGRIFALDPVAKAVRIFSAGAA